MASAAALGSHLSGGRINLAHVREAARSDLRDCLENCPHNKWLILDEEVLSLLNLVVEFSFIKELGVTKLLRLPYPNFDEAVKSVNHMVFLIRPLKRVVKNSLEAIDAIRKAERLKGTVKPENKEGRPNRDGRSKISFFFVPYKTHEVSRMLEECNQNLHFIGEYHLDVIPLDSDLLSLQFPLSFKDVNVDNDTGSLHQAAKSLMVIQGLFGIIPHVFGKGEAARLVKDMIMRKRKELFGHNQPEIVPQISTLILIDRSVDLMTPLSTQLTYEGLIDEIYGIKNSSAKLPRARFSDDILPKAPPGQPPPLDFSLQLTSGEEMYAELRDLHINAVGAKLSEKTKRISAAYEERHDVRTVNQIRQFVTKLPYMQTAKQSLSRHTALTELVREITDKREFIEGIFAEQILREDDNSEKTNSYIDAAIGKREPVEKVLRLVCLHSVANNGLKPKLLEQYKRDIVQAYGYQYLLSMNNLEAAGLLKVQEASRAFSAIKQSLRLCNQEVDEKNPSDISYCYSGYAPLSVRLVEHVVKHNGWSGIEELLRYLPGPTVEDIQFIPKGLMKKRSPTTDKHQVVLVYFLGGCTYAEISALRFLSQKEDSNTDYVIATTNFVTGQSMIQSLISDTHDYMPCGPLIDQFSTGALQKYFKPPESRLNIQQKAY